MSTSLLIASCITIVLTGLLIWRVLNLRKLPDWVTVWVKVPILASGILVSVVTLVLQNTLLLILNRFFV